MQSIVRGKFVITRALDRHNWEQIENGAVLQRDGAIAEIGSFRDRELSCRCAGIRALGGQFRSVQGVQEEALHWSGWRGAWRRTTAPTPPSWPGRPWQAWRKRRAR